MQNWYCAKSIESYKVSDALHTTPFIVLENLVLLKAPNLHDAKIKAALIGSEQAKSLGTVVLFNGLGARAQFEGLRSIEAIQFSDEAPQSGPISFSVFQPAEDFDTSAFIEQCRMLEIAYIEKSIKFYGRSEPTADIIGRKSTDDEPWKSAHLLFTLIPMDSKLPKRILEEVRIFAPTGDIWSNAESMGEALELSRQKVKLGSEIYKLRFAGVRESQIITGPNVYTVPEDPTEASHTKFEIDSEVDLIHLLNGDDTQLKLLPSSLCHIQLGKEVSV